jgi:hypothetical protein
MTQITQIKIYRSAFVSFVQFVDPIRVIRAIRGPIRVNSCHSWTHSWTFSPIRAIRGPHSWMSKVE